LSDKPPIYAMQSSLNSLLIISRKRNRRLNRDLTNEMSWSANDLPNGVLEGTELSDGGYQ
jgi:hypothetical protein